MQNIWKRFGATQALSGVSFDLKAGEVHALVGANGAGKSTLSRILSGHMLADLGEITLDGRQVRHATTREAIRNGIAMVTQETSLAPDLSVLENIMLPRIAMPGWIRWREMRSHGKALVAELGQEAGLHLDALVGELNVGQRQMVEILKALALDSKVIIFDEPTAPLSPYESEQLFETMRRLVARGRGLVFVSHRMEEIFTVADRVTVLREGKLVVGGLETNNLTQGELVRLMVGQELTDMYDRSNGRPAPPTDRTPILRVHDLCCPPMVRNVSFEVHAGEVLGLGGLVGAGRSETLETIFGMRRATSGRVELNGHAFFAKSPKDAIRAGIGLIPEDRRRQGIIPDFSVRENLLLAHLGARSGRGLGYAGRADAIRELLRLLKLPEKRLLDSNMLAFSGGMQQKIIMARWLLLAPRLLLLDEPTRGVDIGTRSNIYALLRRISESGVACVVVSSDFDELIGVSDRITVLSDGTSIAELPSRLMDVEKLSMFTAPRSSAERTHTVIEKLVATHGGIAYWIAVENGRVFCFDKVGHDPGAEPGFSTGGFPECVDTAIAHALASPIAAYQADQLVTGSNGSFPTLLVPIFGRRGHSFGIVGLTLPEAPKDFDATIVKKQIQAELSDVLSHHSLNVRLPV